MSNYQAQTPTLGSHKNNQNKSQKKTKISKIEATTMIKDTTKPTTVIGEIQERLHR